MMAMQKNYGEIIYRAREGIALLTIDRPKKVNSISPDGFSPLQQALVDPYGDKARKSIVVEVLSTLREKREPVF